MTSLSIASSRMRQERIVSKPCAVSEDLSRPFLGHHSVLRQFRYQSLPTETNRDHGAPSPRIILMAS